MSRVRLGLFATLACLALLPGLLRSQDQSEKVEKIFNAIEDGGGKNIWAKTAELEELGRGIVDDVRKQLRRPDSWVRLAAAKFLFTQDFKKESVDQLVKLATEDKKEEARRAAASLLSGLVRDEGVDAKLRNEIAEPILKAANAAEDDAAKIDLWLASFHLTGNVRAKPAVIGVFDKTSDKDVKDQAALALAEMGAFTASGLKDHLRALAKEPTERGKLARTQLKIDDLQKQILRHVPQDNTAASDNDYKLLDEIIKLLKQNFHDPDKIEKDMPKILENAARGISGSEDDYTFYLNEDELEKLQKEDLEGEYGGIGARVTMRKDRTGDSWLTITEPIFSGPAYRAGLRSNDRIIDIEGTPTANRDLQELVRTLRGKPGTPVKIKVWSLRWEKPKVIEMNREVIHLDTVQFDQLPGDIGYIKLVTFGEKEADLIKEALGKMQGIKGVILDLRGNGGGYLKTAIEVANIFLDKDKTVVTVEAKNPKKPREEHKTMDDVFTDLPLTVLVDGGSASASEIVSGALRDHKRGVLIGEKTFGKGSVQNTYRLESKNRKAAVKITVARWYLPSSESVEKDDKTKSGIEPNIKVLPTERDLFREREFERLRQLPTLQKYVLDRFEANKKKFQGLAITDGGDPTRYPDFDGLYKALDTRLSKDEVRELLREYVRQVVQDDRKKEFGYDLETDAQLQRAILEVAKMAKIDLKAVKEYDTFSTAMKKDNDKKD